MTSLISVKLPSTGRLLVLSEENGGLEAPLPKVDELSATSQEEKATNLEEAVSSLALANGSASRVEEAAERNVSGERSELVKDGHYFLRVAEETAQELRARVEELERDLKENDLSDEG